MQHVDDGTIHAWLDEQLVDPAEAAAVEEHFRECEACRERLAGERATFDRAQALLADTVPAAERPSFEALVARAGRMIREPETASGEPLVRGRRDQLWMRAGWAASLALAVGLGWTARGLTDRDTARPDLQAAIAEQAAARNDAPSEPAAVPEQAAAPPPAADASSRQERAPGNTANTMARRNEPPPPAAPAVPAPASTVAASRVETITEQMAPAAVAAQRQEASRIAGDTTPLADAPWRPLPRTEAAARTGMPLYGIDGLEPQFTALSADGALVRTLYRLASGDLVELVQQRSTPNSPPSLDLQGTSRAFTEIGRAGVVADRAAAVPRTWSDVRGGVRLTLQTTSEAADLNALGTRLRVE